MMNVFLPGGAATRRGAAPRSVVVVSLTVLAVIVVWDACGLDLVSARLFGSGRGFPLRDHWLLTHVLHDGGRHLAWLLALALCLAVWWPLGVLRRIDRSQRLQLAITALIASATVAALKAGSGTSCPWDLQPFGGVAQHLSHWQGWVEADGGSGHCFPAGHASSGFAFVGGWFAFRAQPRVARVWLAASLVGGLLFGLAQQARGAHFMSHTLWTAWICWAVAWAIDALWRRREPAWA
jgi:membrane-associated PAP2 superfamily phosphatase